MMIQVFSFEDYKKLINSDFRFICENKLGDTTCYTFESNNNKLNFDSLDIKYRLTNKLYF